MQVSIHLGSRLITKKSKPYIIAEIGVNHEGSLTKAKELIRLAKEGGADAAKFQSYKASKLAAKESPSYWDTNLEPTTSQHKLFQKYDSFNSEDYLELSNYCKKEGIDFLSTPFDDDAIDFLDPLMPFFKIASADLTNIEFLRRVGRKSKPVVISTGASTLREIDSAIEELVKSGCKEIALLHCILNYPTDNHNAHIRMIEGLKKVYPEKIIGYSDHTLPDENMTSLTSAYLMGAVIIEKHFTDDKAKRGNDHYHAMDIKDLNNFVNSVSKIDILLGEDSYKQPIDSEQISRKNARRSLVTIESLPINHIISEKDITYKRPGTGIGAEHWDRVIGMKTVKSLDSDHILQWMDLVQVNDNQANAQN